MQFSRMEGILDSLIFWRNFHSDVAGRSFHNDRFIQRMREKASSLPNVQFEQGTVSSLLEDNGTIKGVMYKTKSGLVMKAYAPLTMADVPSCFVGLILENCQLPYENHGHVVLADPSPILFYRISSIEIRCLVDVPGQKVPSVSNGDLSKYLKTVVAPQIRGKAHVESQSESQNTGHKMTNLSAALGTESFNEHTQLRQACLAKGKIL